MSRIFAACAVVLTFASIAAAAEKTWDFEDPKKVNAIGIFLDSKVEPIRGMATGIAGEITYDPENPESFSGTLTVDANSIKMSNSKMTDHLQGQTWLNTQVFKTITFTFTKARVVERNGDEVELKVFGTLTAMGIQIAKDIEIDVTYVPDGAKVRSDGKGDLLVLRSNFSVTRKELGIQLGLGSTKVANKIELDVAIVGYEKRQEEPAASGQ